jgi:acyl-coenzyme A synthetase/AMP-(fatty) acid ligase
MKIQEDSRTSDEAADAQSVIEHAMTGKPLDPEIARRVRERSERATERLRQKYWNTEHRG